jgi:hypothetical protein
MQNEVGRFFGVRLLCDKCIWTSTVRFDSTRGLTVELIREVQGYVRAPPRLLAAQPAGGPASGDTLLKSTRNTQR